MTADLFTAETVPAFAPLTWSDSETVLVGRGKVPAQLLVVTNQFGWTDRYAKAADGTWLRECGRCSDFSGVLPEHAYIFEGVCFLCNGQGVRASGGCKSIATAVERLERQTRKELARLAQVEADRPAMIARELEIRAGIVAKAEVAAYVEAERRGAMRYAGQVGEKVTVTGRVVTAFCLEPAQYGWSSSMLLVIDAGNGVVVKTKTAAEWSYSVQVGETVTISGTVSGTEEYRGALQTIIKRPRQA